MSGWLVVLHNTAALFLVMIAGWLAAKRGLWNPDTGRILSRILIDVVYPCYVVERFLRTINPETLRASGFIPLLGFLVIALGWLTGRIAAPPLFREPVRRRTAVFLVSLTNWIYLPLPIVQGLYGAEGETAILLMNIGCTVAIWTIGVATLNPGLSPRDSLRHALTPGMVATGAGLLLALTVPALRNGAPDLPWLHPLFQAAGLLGQLMIPLSLLVIGAQLGEVPARRLKPEWALGGVLLLRLAATPLLALGLVLLLARFGVLIPAVPRFTFLLVAAMPVALSSTLFTERYNGDSLLSSKAVFFSTLAAVATVPLFFRLAQSLAS